MKKKKVEAPPKIIGYPLATIFTSSAWKKKRENISSYTKVVIRKYGWGNVAEALN